VPRNRSARLAVLASVAQRAAPTPYSSRASSALRRRAVVAALVLVSLALITVYFRESDGGRLHGVQGAASTVLEPFQVGATKVAQPFRDAYGYFSDLVHAKSRVDRLERQNAQLRQQSNRLAVALQENDRLRRIAKYKATPRFPDGYKLVSAEVIAQPQNQYDQTLTIAAGANDGLRRDSAVVDPDGNLVGKVSLAYSRTALVTLLTDETIAVAARDPATAAKGLVKPAQGGDSTMILDRVEKDEVVREGDNIITSGFKWRDLSSLYPPGISIGWVRSTSSVDTENYKTVQVTPYADFSNLDSVVVVVSPPKARGLP
jgi:rod shape-determining protein MreC